MLTDQSETFDEASERSRDEKTPISRTWAQLSEEIIWRYCFYIVAYHLALIAAFSTYIFGLHLVPMKWSTFFWMFIVGYSSSMGVTAGTHRLWSHRSYKAKLPLRILLMILYSTMGGNAIYYWVRDHRVHHKYSETDADPHNASRGFIFAHIGWTVMKRRPECLRRGKEIDMSDIEADEVVMFQKKYEVFLKILFCFVIPAAIPIIFWNETVFNTILTQWIIRFMMGMNFQFSVNSLAHFWGSRPYNKLINPAENLVVSIVTLGEGSHNYHHTFPWDYKAAEFPLANFSGATLFIHTMAMIGWAYDLRQPSPELVKKVIERNRDKLKIEAVQ